MLFRALKSLPRRPWQLTKCSSSSSSSSSSRQLPPSLSGSGKSSSVSHQRIEFKPTGFRVPEGQKEPMVSVNSKGDKADKLRFFGLLSVVFVGVVSALPTHWGQETIVKRLQAREDLFKDSKGKTKEGIFAKYQQENSPINRFVVRPRYVGPNSASAVNRALVEEGGLKQDQLEMARLIPYHVDSLDTFNLGQYDLFTGASLGLPLYYECQEEGDSLTDDQIRDLTHKTLLTFFKGWKLFGPKDADGRNNFDKLSDADKAELRGVLRLSDEAKRFSLAYEVARMRERSIIVLATIPAVVWTTMLTFFFAVDEQLCIRFKSNYTHSGRLGLLFVFVSMAVPLSATFMNLLNKLDDDKTLKVMSESGKDWGASAVKYAEELRKMGILMRRLAIDGEKYFDENGDLFPMPFELPRRTPEEYASIFTAKK